jgi:hypothetical protein
VALKLPFQNITHGEAKELYPEQADRIEEILDGMAVRGTVFRDLHPGKEKRCRRLPSLVGWQERPFWHGQETEQAKVLSPLYKEAFAAEMARGIPLMRVIPIDISLKVSSGIVLMKSSP